jgi:uncharacterized membrane protein
MINNKMNKKGVGWMAGVLITAIFISSIVLVIVLMGIVSDSKVEPPSVPSVDVKESSLTGTGGEVNVGSGGDNVVEDELASGKGSWGSEDRKIIGAGDDLGSAPGLFTEKIGLPKFSMDSQLVGIVIIIVLVLLVLLRNMQAKKKKKKGSRRVRRKSSK